MANWTENMNVLEMIKQDTNSIIGKVVEYDFGGSKTFTINVTHVSVTPWVWRDEDGLAHESYCYGISEGGKSYYTVSAKNTKLVS